MSRAFRESVRPPSPLTPPDWAARYVKIANSERSSSFDISQTPWLRKPMECAGDLTTRQVVFLAPTGCGKSTMAEGLIPWFVSEDPGSILYASQTDPDAKFWVETRLMHALKSCKSIDSLWSEDRHKTRSTEIIFPHMALIAGGANVSNFNEKSCRVLYGDEVWKWNKGLVGLFLKRHHDRWNRKVFLVSQAGIEDDDLHSCYKETDMAEWSFRCSCGEWARYARELLKYETIKNGTEIDVQASMDTARLECPHCSKVYEDTAEVRRKLTNTGDYITTNENSIKGYKGFRMHRLAIWWIPWGNYVGKLLNAKRKLDLGDVEDWKQMKQADDCIPWKEDMALSITEMKTSENRIQTRDPMERIENETARFFTIDKGSDHFWGVIRAWSQGQATELLWEGYIPSTDNEERIKELQKKYGVMNSCVFIDIGFEWGATAQLCGENEWWGIRGNGQLTSYRHKTKKNGQVIYVEKPYSPQRIAQGDNGKRCAYMEIATDPIKDILARLMRGDGLDWTVPKDVSKPYRKHMRSEVRREGQKGRTKSVVGYWEQIHKQNHLWDCEVYSVAAALMVGIFD